MSDINFNLEAGKHFTPVGLCEWLNKNYAGSNQKKKTKHSYNINDIHQYILHGKIPDYLGGQKLTERFIPIIGLKILELE